MYGPGVYLKTNARGFRNNDNVDVKVPAGKVRMICSGDSFTLGYGVDNDRTWCHVLTTLNDRLETVNMGQGGYGVDQAYLWYQRDGQGLDHDIHVFAFITIDFQRMQTDNFQGYGKPMLKLADDDLVPDKVPVSKRSFYVPWLTQNAELIQQLKLVRAIGAVIRRIGGGAESYVELGEEQTQKLARKLFADLQAVNREKNSVLVLVYLPVREDYRAERPGPWRRFVREVAAEKGIALIDLIEDYQKIPPEEVPSLFLGRDVMGFPDAAGHYSVKGNEVIAKMLYDRLLKVPEVAAKLSPAAREGGDRPKANP
jgi:hypothetical protein